MVPLFACLFVLAALVGAFWCGSLYGRAYEAQAIAIALRIESYVKQEYVDVIAKIKSSVAIELERLKKYL